METMKQATAAAPTEPKKARKPRPKASKKIVIAAVRADALLGRRFTHRKRSEWGIGTVVDGADNALVLSWSDGTERRTARSYMDQLIDVP
jgi:hypothetical protein